MYRLIDIKTAEALDTICEAISVLPNLNYAIWGGTSLQLQGFKSESIIRGSRVQTYDIDLFTNTIGAIALYNQLTNNEKTVVEDVLHYETKIDSTLRSTYAKLNIDSVQTEIIGDLEKSVDGLWIPLTESVYRPKEIMLFDQIIHVTDLKTQLEHYRILNRPKDREKIALLKGLFKPNYEDAATIGKEYMQQFALQPIGIQQAV